MGHPYEPDEIRALRAQLREAPADYLFENFIVTTQQVELHVPTMLDPWEFRATWQELQQRGLLTVQ